MPNVKGSARLGGNKGGVMADPKFKILIDIKEQTIEIGGIKYQIELLEMGFPVGAILKVIKKENGCLTVKRLYELEKETQGEGT